MHPADIQAAIKKRGYTPADIARHLKVSRSAVSAVIYGHPSRRIATTIAKLIGRPVDELWPGQYPDEALRKARAARRVERLRAQLNRAMQEAV